MGLAFTEQGNTENPSVVFIHAFPLNRKMWKYQVEGLSQSLHVLAPDLPGFGESPILQKNPSMTAYAESIKNFLLEKKIHKAVFMGCSMGGYVLFEIFRQYKEMVAGLILCDTRPQADTPEARVQRMETIDYVRVNGIRSLAEKMLFSLLCLETTGQTPEKVDEIKEIILSNSTEGIIQALWALASRRDSVELLQSIDAPTLILVGREDVLTPPDLARSMQNHIKNARLDIIPNAGHLSPYEQPHLVNRSIRKFLEESNIISR
ncbi:MAG: alpha/beta hydrolase [Candidatus Omnitrophota bacterium]|jgi:pimeloyl-ACP methyl ester carboxylesterase|nr:MAG: alpha/beta hydrolase [Candidatus Omnitrophota bacterium]